jgi:hypothetical protein
MSSFRTILDCIESFRSELSLGQSCLSAGLSSSQFFICLKKWIAVNYFELPEEDILEWSNESMKCYQILQDMIGD